MTAATKPSWYRTFPQGALTEVQKTMAVTTAARGVSPRSGLFATNWWVSGNAVGHHPDEMYCELGFLPGNFGQPQDIADPTQTLRVEPRPDTPGHFDSVPMILHRRKPDRSPGSDHQGDVWDVDGTRGFQGLIDASSPPAAELGNEFQADVWNALNGRPNNPAVDAYAWYCTFTPFGATGNVHTWNPAVPILACTPEMVYDSIMTGVPLPFAFTFGVDRRCSGNGPQAPHTSTPTVSGVTDIMNDPRCWVPGGWGGSCSPAKLLETVKPLAPVQFQVPDGACLAINCTPDHIDQVCQANGYKPGTMVYKAATVLCENWVYGPGKGGIQAETGGWMVVPCDTSAAAMPGWSWLGFTPAHPNPFRGLITGPEMMVCCNQPTSTDANGKEWLREVAAAHTGF